MHYIVALEEVLKATSPTNSELILHRQTAFMSALD